LYNVADLRTFNFKPYESIQEKIEIFMDSIKITMFALRLILLWLIIQFDIQVDYRCLITNHSEHNSSYLDCNYSIKAVINEAK
jgi:hypothetical protein